MNNRQSSQRKQIALVLALCIIFAAIFSSSSLAANESTNAVKSASSGAAPRYGKLSKVKFVDTSIGYYFGGALDVNGNVWVWGQNGSGQLGNGKTASSLTGQGYAGGIQKVPGLPKIKQFSAGESYGIALDTKGEVWCWGYNGSWQSGNFNGNTLPQRTPIKIDRAAYGMPKIVKVSAGVETSMALDENGDVWSWGTNGYGQHGDSKRLGFKPTKAIIPVKIAEIEMGRNNALALDVNGKVWAWGLNSYGECGNGKNFTIQDTPQKVALPDSVKVEQIAIEQNWALALDSDGKVWQWGHIFSQKSFALIKNVNKPEVVEIDETAKYVAPKDGKTKGKIEYTSTYKYPGAASISAGWRNGYIVDKNGRIWTWGDNEYYGFGVVTDYYGADYIRSSIWSAKAIQALTITGNGDQNTLGKQLSWLHPQVSGSATDPTTHHEYPKQSFPKGFWNEKNIGIDPKYAKVEMPYAQKISTFTSSYIVLDADGNLWGWSYDSIGTILWGQESMNIPLPSHAKWKDSGLWDLFIYEPTLLRSTLHLESEGDNDEIKIEFDSIIKGTNDPVPGFSMASQTETAGDTVTIAPQSISGYDCVGYKVNGTEGTSYTANSSISLVVPAVSPTLITFIYEKSGDPDPDREVTVYIRQAVHSIPPDYDIPTVAEADLVEIQTGLVQDFLFESDIIRIGVDYVKFTFIANSDLYQVEPKLPYGFELNLSATDTEYKGIAIGTTDANLEYSPSGILDFSKSNVYYVTINIAGSER